MALAVCRRRPTAEAWVQSQAIPCGICGAQSTILKQVPVRVLPVFLVSIIPPVLYSHLRQPPTILATDIFFLWRCDPTRVMASLILMFLDHTQRRTTFGRTPLDE